MLIQRRQSFLKESYESLKVGGSMILISPKRNFIADFQHSHYCTLKFLEPSGIYSPFIKFLESYYSIDKYFNNIGPHESKCLPLKNFFGLSVLKGSKFEKFIVNLFKLLTILFDKLPYLVGRSFLNPYLIVKIIKR